MHPTAEGCLLSVRDDLRQVMGNVSDRALGDHGHPDDCPAAV